MRIFDVKETPEAKFIDLYLNGRNVSHRTYYAECANRPLLPKVGTVKMLRVYPLGDGTFRLECGDDHLPIHETKRGILIWKWSKGTPAEIKT